MASGDQYTGRTIHEALIKATLAACKPCCGGSGSGSGSGAGSGSGGGYITDSCCENEWVLGCPANLNVSLTINCASFGTIAVAIPNVSCSPVMRRWYGNSGIAPMGACATCPGLGIWSPFSDYTWDVAVTCYDSATPREFFINFIRTSLSSKVVVNLASADQVLNVISCAPFLAVGGGTFTCGVDSTGCSNCVGATWSATVSE